MVSAAISELLAKLNLSIRWHRAAISIGGSSLLLKRIIMTPGNDSDLGEQVFYEAQQHFQDDLDDMYFRWQEIPSELVASGKKAILLVGAKQEAVEQHLAVVRSLGLRTAIIDCDVLCLANMFEYNYPVDKATVVVVNVGACTTQVILS